MPRRSGYIYCNSIRAVLVFIWIYGIAYPCSGQNVVIGEDVLNKWRAYEHFSRSLQGRAQRTTISGSGDNSSLLIYYKQNQACASMSLSKGDQDLTERCTLANPNYAARIKRINADPARTVLEKFTQRSHGDFPGFMKSAFDMIRPAVSPHFTIDDSFLAHFMLDPTVKVLKMVNLSENGQDLIRVDYSQSKDILPKFKVHVEQQGTIYLDPSHCWCMRRLKRKCTDTIKGEPSTDLEEEIEFDVLNHPSGFPLVKALTSSERRTNSYKITPKKVTTSKTKIEYEWEVNDHMPDEAFTLPAFGVPERGVVKSKKKLPIHVRILIGAASCALLALVFRYLARRRRHRSAPAS